VSWPSVLRKKMGFQTGSRQDTSSKKEACLIDTKIILIYCICSDFLRKVQTLENSSFQISESEVLTLAIVAAMFFQGSHENSRKFLKEYRHIPNMLSKSQLNRRLHAFDEGFWRQLFYQLLKSLMHYENTHEYAIDSFPVSTCDTPRIMRANIFNVKSIMDITQARSGIFTG
jgi:hypothetical protein